LMCYKRSCLSLFQFVRSLAIWPPSLDLALVPRLPPCPPMSHSLVFGPVCLSLIFDPPFPHQSISLCDTGPHSFSRSLHTPVFACTPTTTLPPPRALLCLPHRGSQRAAPSRRRLHWKAYSDRSGSSERRYRCRALGYSRPRRQLRDLQEVLRRASAGTSRTP
jgi:hypothetical protein